MKILSLPLMVFLILSCKTTPDDHGKSRESDGALSETVEAFNTAFAAGDVDIVEPMIVESYLHTNGNAVPIRKDDWVKYLRLRKDQIARGELSVTKYEMSEILTDFYDDTAIVTGRIDVSYTQNGQTRNDAYRVTQLWVKDGNAWKRAAFHDTRIL